MPNDQPKVLDVDDALEMWSNLPWQKVLEVFLPVRLATMNQITKGAGLPSRQVKNVVQMLQQPHRMRNSRQKEKAIALLPTRHLYAGRSGKQPAVYGLQPLGARLLEWAGHAKVRACTLADDSAIAHAVCTLDIRLAAEGAGLAVQTEKALGSIRPDNLVTLADGRRTIYETEQRATPHLLKRIVEKLRRLEAFFDTAPDNVARQVQVLFNVSAGEWPRTRKIWQQALTAVCEERDRPLSFTLWARPLSAFRQEPAWGRTEAGEQLVPLLTGSPRQPAPVLPGPESRPQRSTTPGPSAWPKEWRWDPITSTDETLLRAYQRLFEAELAGRTVRPALHFLRLVQIIYAASHVTDDPLAQVAVPQASLWQLRRLLESHPRWRQALIRGLQEVYRARYGSVSFLQDRMTALIWDVFLRHQGFAPGPPLRARVAFPERGGWESRLHVEVSIAKVLLAGGEDEAITDEEQREAEAALKWVLEALFCYTRELGLVETRRRKEK